MKKFEWRSGAWSEIFKDILVESFLEVWRAHRDGLELGMMVVALQEPGFLGREFMHENL